MNNALAANNWRVYGVLSHTCPLKYEPVEMFQPMIDQSTVDRSTEIWLDAIEDKLEYEKWYCGHYHTEKRIDKYAYMPKSKVEFWSKKFDDNIKRDRVLNENDTNVKNLQYNIVIRFKGKYNCVEQK